MDKFELPHNTSIVVFGHVHPPIREMAWFGVLNEKSSKAKLREAFLHLENEVPGSVARQVRNLRHPNARWVRLPIGVLFVLGGLLAPVLPILGVWMIPLGLLLLAYDVPFLRRPTANFTIWSTRKWIALKKWFDRRVRRSA